MKKQKNPILVSLRVLLTFLTTIGLFCVLVGCEITFRDAADSAGAPSEETEAQEPLRPEQSEAETQKVPETEEIQEEIVNFEMIPSTMAEKWIDNYSLTGDPNAVILDGVGIASLNEKIRTACPTMYDMRSVPEGISGEEIIRQIMLCKAPQTQKYDSEGNAVTRDRLDLIEGNRNLTAIPESVTPRTAVVTTRANIRTLPTDIRFYDENDTNHHYDRIQEAELIVGTPILVLHESGDGTFVFVQSYYYRGWVRADRIAYAEMPDYLSFMPDRDNMVYITASVVTLPDGTRLDMGAALPYISSDETSFTVLLPRRGEDGALHTEEAAIGKESAHFGPLPYTWGNFASQAFKFLGTEYSWGGYMEGVDCSGFVCAVFRSFGIMLPRNTGEQKTYGGTVIPLSGMDGDGVRSVLGELSAPTALHRPGHVMLYLGMVDGGVYVIHAPRGGECVGVMELEKLDNLICSATVD
ncbi:MAG: hypothetical protein E7638_08400 [Ruminococcaceae bacterium]|nr:hypothetical protein [Oscillospiraceae bacterium]